MARRILLLITDLEIGGTPTVVRELATRLNDPSRGVHVEVACLSKWGPVADPIREAGVTVTPLNATRSWQLPGVVKKLRRLVCDHSIDTVFSFLIHANAVAALAASRLPHVCFIQSIQTTQSRPRWHWAVQRMAQARARHVIVPSPSAADAARQWAAVPAERIVIIPNAVDVDALSAIEPERAALLERLHEEELATRVGFLGRLDPVKRVDVLIRAMRAFCSQHITHYRLELFGDGPQRAKLESLAHSQLAPLMEYVFHGAVASPVDALKQIDMLVLPSDAEGFGLVLIEAMAAGVPVVATNVRGIRDVVRHEHNGLLVPPGTPSALSDAIRRVAEDSSLRETLRANGIADVRERYTWPSVLDQYRRLLGI